ncbi:hypothetical protein CEXT_757821 [Caerostris extrusa]|uniref:Uncharacterized protein n=1 Tax=Caerostris extrusa TaxID=172846 RepID=A0AAV4P3A4_CAEEX|nr:hypothetical protein CEXT_757821 [Caerostris extrusa]
MFTNLQLSVRSGTDGRGHLMECQVDEVVLSVKFSAEHAHVSCILKSSMCGAVLLRNVREWLEDTVGWTY